MAVALREFIRPDLLSLGGYTAAKSPDTLAGETELPIEKIIKLDANENPYGCSPRVSKALASYHSYHVYPDAEQTLLREQLASYTGGNPEGIVAANGSNQLIDLITRLFVGPGDAVINCVPTFDIYRFSTQICGGRSVEVQRDARFGVNIKALQAAVDNHTRLIFLANPNAPTGNLTPEADIKQVLELGLPTVVDEAYYEFSGTTVLPLMEQYPNLMVVRTFSKWSGLAGLRLGYGLFLPEIAGWLHRIKIPYNVNVAALVAVRESLLDLDYLIRQVNLIVAERKRLFNSVQQIEWLRPYPSVANFILCLLKRGNARDVQQRLQDKGILVRYFDKPRLENCIRISVGTPSDTDAVIKALREIGEKL